MFLTIFWKMTEFFTDAWAMRIQQIHSEKYLLLTTFDFTTFKDLHLIWCSGWCSIKCSVMRQPCFWACVKFMIITAANVKTLFAQKVDAWITILNTFYHPFRICQNIIRCCDLRVCTNEQTWNLNLKIDRSVEFSNFS